MCRYATPESAETLTQRYQDQARKQRALAWQLRRLRDMLASVGHGFRVLLTDDHFTTLLRAESLDRVPTVLVDPSVTEEYKSKCHENEASAASALQLKNLSPRARYEFARMVPARQEEFARLMTASGCFTSPYVRALIAASDKTLLRNPKGRPRRIVMEEPQRKVASKEISELAGQLKELSGFGGADLIALLVSCRYVQRVLSNRRVRGYLRKRWTQVGDELENTVESYCKSASMQF